jgi:hypothetical protein
VEGITQALQGLLALGIIVAIAIAIGAVRGRAKTARADAVLAPLVPVIGGTVSGGRLRGTYQGHPVEAWPETRNPSPSVSDDPSSSFKVNLFNLKLAEVPGRQYWYCRSQPRLLGAPDFEFGGLVGRGWTLADRLGTLAGYPASDAALEERLRAAGLIRELSGLGARDSGFLPIVSFFPPPSQERLQQLAPLALPEAAQAHFSGELTCEIEMGTGIVPTPEGFRELLETALRVAQINAEANPSEDAYHRS